MATPPTIPSSAPSSTAKEHFFKSPKYLTVSSQLHLEALAHSIPKVWTLSPTFRAEKSDTNRHLSEFYMLEAEISFTNSLEDVMSLVEALTRDIAMGLMGSRVGHEIINLYQNRSLEEKAEGNNIVGGLEERIQSLIRPKPWRRITYTEGISILQDAVEKRTVKFVFEPTWGNALQAEHEKYLAEQYGGDETGAGGPIFVTDYPKQLKPFYMLSSNAYTEEQLDTFPATESTHESSSPSSAPLSEGVNSETVACFDLLLPGVGELAGGSLREHRYDELVSSMVKHGIIPSAEESEMGHMKWYADLRKWGSVRHGGFGMGYERLLAFLAGVENVREVVAFPRWAGKCDF